MYIFDKIDFTYFVNPLRPVCLGVSSVADGLRRYYRTEAEDDDMGANILAPDIFLNLKFAGASSQDSADQPKKVRV